MRIILKLSEKQFEGLDISTRREMIRQLMFIDTHQYRYCIGAKGNLWTMVRYKLEPEYGWRHGQLLPTGTYNPVGDGEIVDQWR